MLLPTWAIALSCQHSKRTLPLVYNESYKFLKCEVSMSKNYYFQKFINFFSYSSIKT